MKKRAGVLFAAGATVAGLITAVPPAVSADAGSATAAARTALKWTDCGTKKYPALQCSSVKVPLNHADPHGKQITLALSRVPHTAKTFQGPLLVNPGGPGGSGLSMAGFVATSLPKEVAAQYDVIGFDPRGVGRSEPALNCRPGHFSPVRPDSVPRSEEDERVNLDRAKAFATACATKYGGLLPYMDTVSTARDLDVVRRALGAQQINYFGYSYGTYLGAVYAKLYPQRVRRLVLDSIVDPTGVWYDDNIGQDYAFDARHKAFAAWVAKHNTAYKLGSDPAKVEAKWYKMREALRKNPAGKKVGPGELEDTFLPGGYYNGYWPQLAKAFASYVNAKDAGPLVGEYENFGAIGAAGENSYSIYAAVQCRDAPWERDWGFWHQDNWNVHAKAPFSTWNNAWYNAPCAFWPTQSLNPPNVSNDELPPALMLQATEDAATPYSGGVTLHRMLPGSSLVVEEGGGNHGVTLSENACLDRYLADYLTTGKVPRAKDGGDADAVCTALPDPKPLPAAARASTDTSKGGALHRLIGFRS
ncbi:alpha/beta fold hydrolase [Streptomyces sp. ISL-98]|uniref:alpha/beta hydrolase n=1 Tax=Streptomyces sp. ISL-98 TaxID=2819192 RepID=UPI001BEB9828|nr:alpha/beta hydrolase [Streptomyces sp. ISL-98]MBT2508956.1 alpha/beta fold hydrolase [Streptomyces sp. ISL-98]